jgi:hypothetical protein
MSDPTSGIRTWVFLTDIYTYGEKKVKFYTMDVPFPWSNDEDKAKKFFELNHRHTGICISAFKLENVADTEVGKLLLKMHKKEAKKKDEGNNKRKGPTTKQGV